MDSVLMSVALWGYEAGDRLDASNISQLKGQTITEIRKGREFLRFDTEEDRSFLMYHREDCCEDVYIEDICGSLADLLGSPVLQAEVVTSETNPEDYVPPYSQDCFLWTFYKLATVKGYVSIRWYGESNGYYSVEVDFAEINPWSPEYGKNPRLGKSPLDVFRDFAPIPTRMW